MVKVRVRVKVRVLVEVMVKVLVRVKVKVLVEVLVKVQGLELVMVPVVECHWVRRHCRCSQHIQRDIEQYHTRFVDLHFSIPKQ